jgi:hypothetical protein
MTLPSRRDELKFDTTEAARLYASGLTIRATARELRVCHSTLLDRFNRCGISTRAEAAEYIRTGPTHPVETVSAPPSLERSTEELIASRRAEGARVRARVEHGEYHQVRIKTPGPVAILHMGDWHLDDPGVDWGAFEADVETVLETPGMYCGLIGDLANNWIGRLARLYATQQTTAVEGWRLVEHYVRALGPRLAYVVLGNHDVWAGAADPMRYIQAGLPHPNAPHEVRIRFDLPGGNQFRLAARHMWPGNSVYHSLQGQVRAHRFGLSDDLVLGGHKHVSGYAHAFNSHTGALSHLIQIGSYKVIDDYAAAGGFEPTNHCPSVVTVFDPSAGMQGRFQVFERDAKTGHANAVAYLKALRSRQAA